MLCVLFFCVNLWEIECTLNEKRDAWDSLGSFFSHRTHRSNRAFLRTFRAHRRPSAYRIHRTFQLKLAVTFCDIGWLNVSVRLCVFCFSVYFCEKKKCPQREKEMSSVKERIVLCEGINTNRKDRDCQDISAATPLSFRGHALLHWRRRLSAIEKRPFKGQEHAPLEARKACSRMLLVNFWFLVGYKLEERGEYTSIS